LRRDVPARELPILKAHRQRHPTPLSAKALIDAWVQRDLARAELMHDMATWPILICPVSATPAFKHGEREWRIDGRSVGADAIAIRLHAACPDGDSLVAIAAVVAKEVFRPVVGADRDIEIAVAIVVSVGGAARDDRPAEIPAHRGAGVLEAASAEIAPRRTWRWPHAPQPRA
jgi:hypothetical protein